MSEIALLGSVFLPGSTFDPLAEALEQRGHHVRIANAAHASTAHDALEAYRAALDHGRGTVGVAHSNAGAYVPALAASGCLDSAVFMDAVLPGPGGGTRPVVRPDLGDLLRPRVVDGALPRWTEWWPIEDVRALFPDAATFTAVHAATPRIPAGYLDDTVEVPAGWMSGLRAGFLAFGEAYADERRLAESLGWPTHTIELGHLGHLLRPDAVADELTALVEGWAVGRPA
ncbi:alpha/beta fold hydrolase [Agromyces sp. ZXT2-6]|uniref:alpha/beta fold hydrolase n=1 Tax=Agromyces sp. ZXT2-6 TaxID=3461153 RepID=UPI004054E7FA